jgi:hypothetical protein
MTPMSLAEAMFWVRYPPPPSILAHLVIAAVLGILVGCVVFLVVSR